MAKTKETAKPDQPTAEQQLAADQSTAAKVDVCKDCEMRGMGGSYIFDPVTSKRRRVAGPKINGKINPAASDNKNGGAE